MTLDKKVLISIDEPFHAVVDGTNHIRFVSTSESRCHHQLIEWGWEGKARVVQAVLKIVE